MALGVTLWHRRVLALRQWLVNADTTDAMKIVSGGQTGVDRAALDVALKHGIECGGWCPAGRLDEVGRIPDRYPLRELAQGSFADRTLENVKDSDGTIVIYFGEPR